MKLGVRNCKAVTICIHTVSRDSARIRTKHFNNTIKAVARISHSYGGREMLALHLLKIFSLKTLFEHTWHPKYLLDGIDWAKSIWLMCIRMYNIFLKVIHPRQAHTAYAC